MTSLPDLEEFGLIARLRHANPPAPASVLCGLGDDAAVLRPETGTLLLLTTDALLEGVHFDLAFTPPFSLGQKALAVNVSDIAAMGGTPRYATISLALPADAELALVDDLYAGFWAEARETGVALVGGDTTSSQSGLVLSVTLLGDVLPDGWVGRAGARAGDTLWVTGALGGAAAGLLALRAGLRASNLGPQGRARFGREWTPEVEEGLRAAIQAYLTPRARLIEGRGLAAARLATAMLDVSDGVGSDLGHLCTESDVAAVVWETAVPLHPGAQAARALFDRDPLALALGGGEDYEILFTSSRPPGDVEAWAGGHGLAPPRQIGCIEPGPPRWELGRPDGRREPLRGGFDHFRRP